MVFVHAKAAEEKFVAEGFGVKRYPVMYNDFVLVGPKSDPAGIKGSKDIVAALKTIEDKAAPFVSRGDKSGTHVAELALWKAAGIDIEKDKGAWYRAIGQGMGAALNTASATNAYVLADRGTWLSFKNRGELAIAGRRRQAAVQPVRRHAGQSGQASAREEGAGPAFIDWLVSPEGQKAIADYKIDGEQLFFPNANDPAREAPVRARRAGRSEIFGPNLSSLDFSLLSCGSLAHRGRRRSRRSDDGARWGARKRHRVGAGRRRAHAHGPAHAGTPIPLNLGNGISPAMHGPSQGP